jgi:hypothetical protein
MRMLLNRCHCEEQSDEAISVGIASLRSQLTPGQCVSFTVRVNLL